MHHRPPLEPSPGVRIEGDAICVASHDAIRNTRDRAVAMQAHHLLPLLQAAERGELALGTIMSSDVAFPVRQVERWRRPAVILVADDPWPDGEARGPTGWACARRLRYWAPRAVIVHGTGQHPDHYRMAATLALVTLRLAFIETDSAHIEAWAAFLGCPNTICIRPPEGCSHPDETTRKVMQ